MVLETTYYKTENKKITNDLVGKPFSIFKILKMKGIGLKRMIVDDVSPNLSKYLNIVSDLTYANIELRPLGILVFVNKGLRNFTWIIPYYQFYIYKTNGISIHAQGRYIHFKNNRTHKENLPFFEKLMKLKIEYDIRFPHVDSIEL